MMVCEMASPIPMPFGLVVKNGSKSRSILSGAIPAPVSLTDTSTVFPPVVLALTVSNLCDAATPAIESIPFKIRFNSTCCRCTRSPRTAGNFSRSCKARKTLRARASGCAIEMASSSSSAMSRDFNSRLRRFNKERIRLITCPARRSSLRMSARMARISSRSGFSF